MSQMPRQRQRQRQRQDGHAWIWKHVERDSLLHVIQESTLTPTSVPVTSHQQPEILCSYSWKNCFTPYLWVPGQAPTWRSPPLPATIRPDSGIVPVDQNEARSPGYTFWPMFDAVEIMRPGYRFDGVDIIVNRNTLRKLLNFANGLRQPPFRLNLLLVGNTLFVERCEQNHTEVRTPADNHYGHSFEKAFTAPRCAAEASASGHHRVLCYNLGNLCCAVRFEVDACYLSPDAPGPSTEGGSDNTTDVQSLLVQMGDLRLTETKSSARADPVPQSVLAELKSTAKPKSPTHFLPQLWFGRVPWLIVGTHRQGTFDRTRVVDALALFPTWEARNQMALRKVVRMLQEFRDVVQRNNGRNCVAVCDDSEHIKVFASTNERKPLPASLIRKHWRDLEIAS